MPPSSPFSQKNSPQNQDDQNYDTTPLRFGSLKEIYKDATLKKLYQIALRRQSKTKDGYGRRT